LDEDAPEWEANPAEYAATQDMTQYGAAESPTQYYMGEDVSQPQDVQQYDAYAPVDADAEYQPQMYQEAASSSFQREASDVTQTTETSTFSTPQEATVQEPQRPVKQVKNLAVISEDARSVGGNSLYAPTEVSSMFYTDDVASGSTPAAFWEDVRSGRSRTQQMRMNERLAVRHNIQKSESAIIRISRYSGEHDAETWESAAQWQLVVLAGMNVPYLEHFGYLMADEQCWAKDQCTAGPLLEVALDGHFSRYGHTWYNIKCKLSRVQNGSSDTLEWIALRRLVQLRVDLHNRVREELGPEYDVQFQNTRFAKLGGPPGTTARLHAWFTTLANSINKGIALPQVATIALVFLQAPVPEGIPVPVGEASLRQSGDSHSNLGGGDGNSNLGTFV